MHGIFSITNSLPTSRRASPQSIWRS
uniref:Uncharacterized protein n=1 Tax=Anguilla anguilla TaxID=7936 RepID=A0A0E9QWD8_ANGAN